MPNFYYQNNGESIDFELIGSVGSNWFEDGIEVDTVKNLLSNNPDKKINIKISSLGGDLNTALIIHDLLKAHKNDVNISIIGLTASAGTIIAAGSKPEKPTISRNAAFLIHNASTFIQGNSDELKKEAENLAKFDDIISDMYQELTGMSKSDILDLMSKEIWLTPKEAKKYGFVSKIIAPEKIISNEIIKNINNSNLPKYQNMENTNEKKSNFFNKLEQKIENLFTEKVVDISNDSKQKYENEIAELKAIIEANKSNEQKIKDLELEISEYSNKVASLESEIVKYKGTEIPVNNQDKATADTQLDAWALQFKELANNL